MSVVPVVMPRLGESVVEATLTKWLVKVGDAVQVDQTLAEAATDKADTELPSPSAGRIARLLVQEGQTVAIGALIAEIDPQGAVAGKPAPQAAARPAPVVAPVAAAPVEDPPPSAPIYSGPPAVTKPSPKPAPRPAPRPTARPRVEAGTVRSSPLVRRMAREHDVDLARVPGTGANGRVTKNDLLDWLSKRTPGSATATLPTPGAEVRPLPFQVYKPPEYRELPGDERVPFTRRRRLIAEHMVYSKHTSPHVFCLAEVDLGRVETARKASAAAGTPVSFLSYVASAVVRAVRDVPIVNATVLPDAYVVHKVVNLGVAVDTPEGLVVPVLRNAQDLGLAGFTRAIAEAAEKARSGKLTADDLSGGTLTLSNPGPKGNTWGAAVINQPQVAIVRMGSIVKRPVVVTENGEDRIVIRPVVQVVLSYDHRIIDGVAANAYLFRVRELLENPES